MRTTAEKYNAKPKNMSSNGQSMSPFMVGLPMRITVASWCSKFHQFTENLMMGTFTTPTIANTALALAPEGAEDGFVHPAELAALGLQAELVVLSACRTAGGVIVRGEGIQGLAAPLLAAGARAVAATWWPIG